MRPILFSIGRLNFYSYGFFTAIGFIAAGLVIDYLAKKKKLVTRRHREYFVIDGLLFSLVLGVLGSRIGYTVLYSFIFPLEPVEIFFDLTHGGFVFLIGLACGLGAFIWWLRQSQDLIMGWLDIVIIGVLAGYGLSELGGYLNDGQIVHLAGLVGTGILSGIGYYLLMTEKRAGKTFCYMLFLLLLLFFFLGFWEIERVRFVSLGLTQWVSLLAMILVAVIPNIKLKKHD